MKTINVPTGKILVDNFEKGPLEFLSIGDYGQAANIKADFLGLDNPINGVQTKEIMPLEEKWVVTISTQYGCNMNCSFCDVPLVGKGKNASSEDMLRQISKALHAYPDVETTKRLNLHFARMGEPTFNPAVLDVARTLSDVDGFQRENGKFLEIQTLHPVLTTMMPKKNRILEEMVYSFVEIKNKLYNGDANIQVSINSTNDEQREQMYRGSARTLDEIGELVKDFPAPVGRKYCVNMAMADGYESDGQRLAGLFNPDHWMVKITPIHVNTSTTKNNIQSTDGYTLYDFYSPHEENFKKAGFDTLVFIPSYDEDYGMITCGNAVLSGRMPETPYTVEGSF